MAPPFKSSRLTVGVIAQALIRAVSRNTARVRWPVHLPVGLGHEHRLALMDRDLRRSDRNLECHFVTSPPMPAAASASWFAPMIGSWQDGPFG